MTAKKLVDELNNLIRKHGDKVVYADGFEVIVVDYNDKDDCVDLY